jgi:hypothetical protein
VEVAIAAALLCRNSALPAMTRKMAENSGLVGAGCAVGVAARYLFSRRDVIKRLRASAPS